MGKVSTNDFRPGMKIEIEGQPYTIIINQFVKPGKGNAFNRVRVKHLLNAKVIEMTFKSGETFDEADVREAEMRMLYNEADGVVFMDDKSFEQYTIPSQRLEDVKQWLMEDIVYSVIFYKGEPVLVEPPTFMDLKIEQTDPGVKGNTASGRVLKPAVTESGAKIQIPIFIDQGELVKVDTRTGEYVSRSTQ
jgi:elongation factor P